MLKIFIYFLATIGSGFVGIFIHESYHWLKYSKPEVMCITHDMAFVSGIGKSDEVGAYLIGTLITLMLMFVIVYYIYSDANKKD